ncbi:MAG: hypothetical protein OHK0019_00740 [Saprospiraceae bacterium]
MEQEYSPEKWAINDVDNSLIYSEETAFNVAKVFGNNKYSNARRIVACVNACEGFETEFLERSGNDIFRKSEERFDKALGKISRLLQQNAEFVFLLRQADKLDRDGYTLTSSWFHEVRNALSKHKESLASQDAGQH